MEKQDIIIYNTVDGKSSVALFTRDGDAWMNQNQLAELFDTSVPNISMHISKILKEKELESNSVVKDYLTTESEENIVFSSTPYNTLCFLVKESTNAERSVYKLE